jgi:hypothetical protein
MRKVTPISRIVTEDFVAAYSQIEYSMLAHTTDNDRGLEDTCTCYWRPSSLDYLLANTRAA